MWKNINISANHVLKETTKAVLIMMPNNSEYEGYRFWHPSKLVREGRNNYAYSIGYTDEFVFNLKKYGNGKYNKYDVIDEKSISVEEFEAAFEIIDENIKGVTSDRRLKPFATHIPKKLEPVDIEADSELVDE